MVSTVGACELTRWTQPPDAENRMSGGVGGLTGAIPLVRPDRHWRRFRIKRLHQQ